MTALRPLQAATYPAYLEAAIHGYAQDNVSAGRWPQLGAIERSREDFKSLLPHGLDTSDNFLFEILVDKNGPIVGYVWYKLERNYGSCSAYVYDLEVKPEYRRQGHAWRPLKALELLAAEAGATSIGLNVFINNVAAQALYQKLGYMPTNINMSRPLARAEA